MIRKRYVLPGVPTSDLMDLTCLTSAEAEPANEISIETRRRLSPAAIRACPEIGKVWALEPNEIAGLLAMTPAHFDTALAQSDETVRTSAGLQVGIRGCN